MSIFIPPYILKASEQTKKVAIKSGLIRPQGEHLENVELRAMLHKAVDDADLNVSERMALNKRFFPYGGGVPVCKNGVSKVYINTFHKPGEPAGEDSFAKECNTLDEEYPQSVKYICEKSCESNKSNYQTNLNNALKKLKNTLKLK